MQYRVSFLLMTSVRIVARGGDLLAILILFNYFGELDGWRGGVALCPGHGRLWADRDGSCRFDVFPQSIQRREFDRALLRPVGIFVQVLAADFQLRCLGRVAQGGLALELAWA